jgi:hypothetical protein
MRTFVPPACLPLGLGIGGFIDGLTAAGAFGRGQVKEPG